MVTKTSRYTVEEKIAFAKNLRDNPTEDEQRLYTALSNHSDSRLRNFQRQKILAGYIVDIYFPDYNLVVEVDGKHHYKNDARLKDLERTENLEQYGYAVIRVTNDAVMKHVDKVCGLIQRIIDNCVDVSTFRTTPIKGESVFEIKVGQIDDKTWQAVGCYKDDEHEVMFTGGLSDTKDDAYRSLTDILLDLLRDDVCSVLTTCAKKLFAEYIKSFKPKEEPDNIHMF